MKIFTLIFFLLPILVSAQDYYFPPQDFNTWETSPYVCDSLATADLIDFVREKNTKAFIMLKEGRIVLEGYAPDFGRDSIWYWASAAKTITSTLIGMAVNDGDIDIDDPTENYLDQWTACSEEDQTKITVRNQLTMTTGFDNTISFDCTDPSCLECLHEPGARWFYQNGPYTLLLDVFEAATGQTANQEFFQRIGSKIGMSGLFVPAIGTDNQVFFSRARDMARFGLLHLANGVWNGETIFDSAGYFEDAKNTSQQENKSYGYLWWLNGKESFHIPNSDLEFSGSIIPTGPNDMYMALGKNDQKIYVVPSQDLVVVRMGDSADGVNFASSAFDNQLWEKLNNLNCMLPTSTNDISTHLWKLSPNPANGIVNINGEEFSSWELVNVLGQRQMIGDESSFSTSGLSAGQYSLRIFGEEKNVVGIERLIVQ